MNEPFDELHGDGDGAHEDDVLDGLRDAWRALPTPDPERGADGAQSEQVVAWLRGAWDALEAPPPAVVPILVRSRAGQPPRRLPRAWLGLAAAAVLALWLVLARDDGAAPVDVDVAAQPGEETASGSENTPGTVSTDPPGLARVEVTEITPERMELRSGPVRLLLLNEWTETSEENAQIGER